MNIKFSWCPTIRSKCKHREKTEENLQSKLIFHIIILNHINYILIQTIINYFKLKSSYWNEREYCRPIKRAFHIPSKEASTKHYRVINVFLELLPVLFRQNKWTNTAQKLKFSIKDFFDKCDQIHRKLCSDT